MISLIKKMKYMINSKITLYTRKKKWRRKNSHNYTTYGHIGYMDNVHIGNYTYGEINMQMSRPICFLKIGNFCSIAKNVFFIPCSDHPTNYIMTYPFKTMFEGENVDAITTGDIVIEDDVWIGYGSTILSGVHIGQGAIIAAGAVVCSDVSPYAIVGGVPAKIIKYRFSEQIINELLKIDYSKITKDMIYEHEDEFYTELHDINEITWLPKKEGE